MTPQELHAYEDTLFHIELIRNKIARLVATQMEAERQVLHRIGRDFIAGDLPLEGLLALYERYRDLVCPEGSDGKRAYYLRPGFSVLWNEAVPIHHSRVAQAAREAWMLKRYEPNYGAGWSGESPLVQTESRPRDGQCVVYVLFDEENTPCYVGSTENFKSRIDRHAREKSFTCWVAHPCEDREAAYELEVKLLIQHKPYLNKKVGR